MAGGLLASELINRPTAGLDLFASAPVDAVTAARDSFVKALDGRGWEHRVLVDSPTFMSSSSATAKARSWNKPKRLVCPRSDDAHPRPIRRRRDLLAAGSGRRSPHILRRMGRSASMT